MGFTDYSKSNRDNRKLQQGITSGYFKRMYASKKIFSATEDTSLEKSKLQKEYKTKRHAILKSLFLTTLGVIVMMIVSFQFIDKQIVNYCKEYNHALSKYRHAIKANEEYNAKQDNDYWYKYHLAHGKEDLLSGQFESAIRNFFKARQYLDQGKDANIGLAVAFSYDCTNNKNNCDLANHYYKKVRNSNTLTEEDVNWLETYR